MPECDSLRRHLLRAAVAGSALALAGCSATTLINQFTPAGSYRATRDLRYGSGNRRLLDVYQPSALTAPAPVIVFFYGGNWDSGARADYLFAGAALAARGYLVAVPDYRLFPEVRFPDFLDDCAAAVRWTVDHAGEFGGDPARIFLMGHSAGAYNAAMLALDPEYLHAAGVEQRRIRGLIGLAGPYDFRPLLGEVTRAVFGYPDTPARTQPISFAAAGAPRSLLVTGSADDIVDPGNSRRLAARLREQGAPVREIEYANIGHRTLIGALALPLQRLAPVLDDIAAFIEA
jgi:acetyl esterase/lipase